MHLRRLAAFAFALALFFPVAVSAEGEVQVVVNFQTTCAKIGCNEGCTDKHAGCEPIPANQPCSIRTTVQPSQVEATRKSLSVSGLSWLTRDPECLSKCGATANAQAPICSIVAAESLGDENSGAGTSDTGNVAVQLKNPLGITSVPALVARILKTMFGILGAGAFLMFVYGGLLWLISGGSADRIKQGKNVMVWATLGLVLVFASAALVRFTLFLFGAGG